LLKTLIIQIISISTLLGKNRPNWTGMLLFKYCVPQHHSKCLLLREFVVSYFTHLKHGTQILILWPRKSPTYFEVINVLDGAKKKNMCGINFFLSFFIIDKTGNSRSRFRYLIFENSSKMTNYAVFLPSLLSISTKS
jgi:hypothetical protein